MSQEINTRADFFTPFKESVDSIASPKQFTYPFFYEPHPLCQLASAQLQQHLQHQTDWEHDFGLDGYVDGVNVGKMFGVLVVENADGDIGFLSAFSGKLADQNLQPGFVPPVADYLTVDGFFRKGEKELEKINAKVEELSDNLDYQTLKEQLTLGTQQAKDELNALSERQKQAKAIRNIERIAAKDHFDGEQLIGVLNELDQQSKKAHFDKKDLKKKWEKTLKDLKSKIAVFETEISQLKTLRRKRSAELQQQIFDEYQFLNQAGEQCSVSEIFKKTAFKIPPSGAGDCAMPKLLQFAFKHQMKPLAMAEFWWGQSPKSEIRKHGYFYPSCKGKCEPILTHMLKGMDVEESPMAHSSTADKKLETVFEDDHLLVINKPHEFLSVPGKTNADSVMSRIQQKYPDTTGPLMVHRLDRATSGLMLIAKRKEVHEHLQKQFLNKTIQKRYVAILEGELPNDEGLIDLPIRPDIEDRPRQLVDFEHGKSARTKYQVLSRSNGRTIVHFWPVTGRTHQLRMHAAHHLGLNAPIVGDDLYGKADSRLYLHAEAIEFVHPISDQTLKFEYDANFQ